MKKFIIFILILLSIKNVVRSQDVIEIPPLFEYTMPPEEIQSLEERCNYLVKNFWNKFDYKNKNAVDQYALNEAFYIYASALRFANEKEIDQSLDQLLKKLSGNAGLLLQFGKVAEENLYGPRANFWSDDIYLKFLDAIIKNKKIKEERKIKFINQAASIRESSIGQIAPSFWFTDSERASKQYFPMSTPTIIIFGDPDNTDWRLSRLKMESNYQFINALEKGKINVLYIIPKSSENWQNLVSNYNKLWTVGQSEEVTKHYDIRLNPTIYIIGNEGKILDKNITPETAVNSVLELIN